MIRVLIVEDEEDFADPLAFLLRKEDFSPAVATTGSEALEEFDRTGADIVLLDLMLPGMSGTDVCKQLRARSAVPVIMVTARDSEIDKVVGLELGADDYVTKPYSARELIARIRAVLRRGGKIPDGDATLGLAVLEAGPVRMDVERHTVTVAGQEVGCPSRNSTCSNTCCATSAASSPATSSSIECGDRTTSATPRPWTCTSSGYAPRSSSIPHRPGTCSPSAGLATSTTPKLASAVAWPPCGSVCSPCRPAEEDHLIGGHGVRS